MSVRKVLFFFLTLVVITIYFSQIPRKRTVDTEIEGWERESVRNAIRYLKRPPRILPDHFCIQNHLLLVMVHSAPRNLEARRLIRRTWARSVPEPEEVAIFFLLGTVEDPALQDEIVAESELFGDIIQADFLDSYRNLTLKSVTMLKLATLRCHRTVRFLLKSDDDTFVNPKKAVRSLSRLGPRDLLLGYLVCGAEPERRPTKKWYTPAYIFSDAIFPRYLTGGAYLMSVRVARKLYRACLRTPMVHIEDIYVTGICAERAGIRPRHSRLFRKKKAVFRRGRCSIEEALSVQDVTGEEMEEASDAVLDDGDGLIKSCTIDVREEFSFAAWFLDSVLKFTDNPYSYRKSCV